MEESLADILAEETKKKKPYETPVIIDHGSMRFPKEVMEYFTSEAQWCFACTNCNCN
jgi:hypothetical protein